MLFSEITALDFKKCSPTLINHEYCATLLLQSPRRFLDLGRKIMFFGNFNKIHVFAAGWCEIKISL